jgi:glycosyltransferase involved in cell wall biosynthesis
MSNVHKMKSTKKYKILRIITNSEPEPGGSSNHVYLLSTMLDRRKFETTVACGMGEWLISNLHRSNINIIALPTLVRKISLMKDLLTIFKLYSIIKKERFDIVATHSTKAGILGRIAARLASAPVVIFTAHGFIFNEPMGFVKRQLMTLIEWIGGLLSDHIIAISDYDAMTAVNKRIINPSKISTIYNGLDFKRFKETNISFKKEISGISNKTKILGTVANFYPNKGLQYLIEALVLVVQKYSDIKLVLVGDGPLRDKLEASVKKLNLNNFVIFLGHRSDVLSILTIFDIFILSSLKEGFPWAILEAMASGKAIVSTNVGGIPKMIENKKTGVLVPPKDSKALANAIITLLKNEEKAKTMSIAAKEKVVSEFTLDRMLNETEKLYTNILKPSFKR